MEDLDDVAILVPDESDVREVNDFLNQRGVNTQVHYRTGNVVPFRTVNTLDFSNNDLPCILTYYAAKGLNLIMSLCLLLMRRTLVKEMLLCGMHSFFTQSVYLLHRKANILLKDVSKENIVEIEIIRPMFYYISTNSWNLLESFVSESISPFSFYQVRGYGNNLSRYLDGTMKGLII